MNEPYPSPNPRKEPAPITPCSPTHYRGIQFPCARKTRGMAGFVRFRQIRVRRDQHMKTTIAAILLTATRRSGAPETATRCKTTPMRRTNHTIQILICSLILGVGPLLGGVKLQVREGRPIVDGVYVNGHGPYRFLLDTGANVNLIETGLARKIGMNATFQV